jgi:hypothetical protein
MLLFSLLLLLLQLLGVVVAQLASGPTALTFRDIFTGTNVPAKTYASCRVRSNFLAVLCALTGAGRRRRRRQFFSLVPSPSNQTVQLLVKLYWTVNGSNYDVQIEAPWTFKLGWLAVSCLRKEKKRKKTLARLVVPRVEFCPHASCRVVSCGVCVCCSRHTYTQMATSPSTAEAPMFGATHIS